MKEYCSNGPPLILLLTVILLHQVSGQHTIKNATLAGVDFSSPGYVDGLNYGVNSTRDYRFQTYYVNHTLKLEVVEFVLEASDKNADCLYDKVIIYDGYNSSASILRTLCGTISAGTTYTTTGDTVYVVFISDGTNTYKGFKMTVYSDGPTTTTSTTTTSTTTTSTTTSSTTATTSAAATATQSPTTSAPGVISTTSNVGTTSTTSTTTKAAATTTSASGVNPTASTVGNIGNRNQHSDSSGSSYTIWIIVGCSIGGALLLILIILAVCWYLKSKRPVSPPGVGDPVKRVLWSRTNTTMVQPIEKNSIPPGEVVQTNIFDMELPVATGKANLLPPLSSKLEMTPKPALD